MDKVIFLAMGHDPKVQLAIAVEIGGSEALAVSKILQFGWRKNESALPVTKIDENDSLIRAAHREIKLSVVVEIGQNSAVGSAFSSDQVIAVTEPTQTIAQMNFRVIAPVGASTKSICRSRLRSPAASPLGRVSVATCPFKVNPPKPLPVRKAILSNPVTLTARSRFTVLVQIARYEKLGQGQAAGSVVAKGRRQKDRRKNKAREG